MVTPELRVAIVGAGPAGLYAAGQLLEQYDLNVAVDIYERLPTPHGLVRAGVAPDHPDKKLVVDNMFDIFLSHPQVRFFGNVEIGQHITCEQLSDSYHAVIYSVGAASDVKLGIAGEQLAGSWAAREFVAWYNGHPDYSGLEFDFSAKRAVVVGNGNVALDVARILTLSEAELRKTDIADYAIEALAKSNIEEVLILGRRDYFQGAFNNPELEELEHLHDIDVLVDPMAADPAQAEMLQNLDWPSKRKLATLQRLVDKKLTGAKKRIKLQFLSSPSELLGNDKVEQVRVVKNKLVGSELSALKAQATDQTETVDAGLVLRAIGYRGAPLGSLPFDESKGVIANIDGRVTKEGAVVPATYVTGWIKRGPKGVIGSNKKCARDTVRCLLDDYHQGVLRSPVIEFDAIETALRKAQPELVTHREWKKIDTTERLAGREQQRPRVKLTQWQQLMNGVSA